MNASDGHGSPAEPVRDSVYTETVPLEKLEAFLDQITSQGRDARLLDRPQSRRRGLPVPVYDALDPANAPKLVARSNRALDARVKALDGKVRRTTFGTRPNPAGTIFGAACAGAHSPGPAYAPILMTRGPSTAFSRGLRPALITSTTPGPVYDIPSTLGRHPTLPSNGTVSVGSDVRFRPGPSADAPGPGAYDAEPPLPLPPQVGSRLSEATHADPSSTTQPTQPDASLGAAGAQSPTGSSGAAPSPLRDDRARSPSPVREGGGATQTSPRSRAGTAARGGGGTHSPPRDPRLGTAPDPRPTPPARSVVVMRPPTRPDADDLEKGKRFYSTLASASQYAAYTPPPDMYDDTPIRSRVRGAVIHPTVVTVRGRSRQGADRGKGSGGVGGVGGGVVGGSGTNVAVGSSVDVAGVAGGGTGGDGEFIPHPAGGSGEGGATVAVTEVGVGVVRVPTVVGGAVGEGDEDGDGVVPNAAGEEGEKEGVEGMGAEDSGEGEGGEGKEGGEQGNDGEGAEGDGSGEGGEEESAPLSNTTEGGGGDEGRVPAVPSTPSPQWGGSAAQQPKPKKKVVVTGVGVSPSKASGSTRGTKKGGLKGSSTAKPSGPAERGSAEGAESEVEQAKAVQATLSPPTSGVAQSTALEGPPGAPTGAASSEHERAQTASRTNTARAAASMKLRPMSRSASPARGTWTGRKPLPHVVVEKRSVASSVIVTPGPGHYEPPSPDRGVGFRIPPLPSALNGGGDVGGDAGPVSPPLRMDLDAATRPRVAAHAFSGVASGDADERAAMRSVAEAEKPGPGHYDPFYPSVLKDTPAWTMASRFTPVIRRFGGAEAVLAPLGMHNHPALRGVHSPGPQYALPSSFGGKGGWSMGLSDRVHAKNMYSHLSGDTHDDDDDGHEVTHTTVKPLPLQLRYMGREFVSANIGTATPGPGSYSSHDPLKTVKGAKIFPPSYSESRLPPEAPPGPTGELPSMKLPQGGKFLQAPRNALATVESCGPWSTSGSVHVTTSAPAASYTPNYDVVHPRGGIPSLGPLATIQ